MGRRRLGRNRVGRWRPLEWPVGRAARAPRVRSTPPSQTCRLPPADLPWAETCVARRRPRGVERSRVPTRRTACGPLIDRLRPLLDAPWTGAPSQVIHATSAGTCCSPTECRPPSSTSRLTCARRSSRTRLPSPMPSRGKARRSPSRSASAQPSTAPSSSWPGRSCSALVTAVGSVLGAFPSASPPKSAGVRARAQLDQVVTRLITMPSRMSASETRQMS